MRLTGYFLPNLIFLLLIVLAWVNIDWVQKTFTYLEEQDSITEQTPILVMRDGIQDYSSPPQNKQDIKKNSSQADASNKPSSFSSSFYSMEFSLLQAYSNKSIQVDDPAIIGYTQSNNEKEEFGISGLSLTTDGDNKLSIKGSPASFSFASDSVQARGSAENILYDTDNLYWLLMADDESPSSKIFWTTTDAAQIIAVAKSIGISQETKMSQLVGKVQLEYLQAADKLMVLSERASINTNNDEIFLAGQVQMEHLTNNKRVTANARNGYYKLDEEFILSGAARIIDHTDGSSIAAEKILYNLDTLTWRVLSQDDNSNKDKDKRDKIEIILPQ